MRLITVEEILKESAGKGIKITLPMFRHYAKNGFLFAPEKKVKRSMREGIVAYYAEEVLDILQTIDFEKREGYTTLEIIKLNIRNNFFLKRLEEIFAGFEDIPGFLTDKVLQWQGDGFYLGLFRVYMEKAVLLKNTIKVYKDVLPSLEEGITQKEIESNLSDKTTTLCALNKELEKFQTFFMENSIGY